MVRESGIKAAAENDKYCERNAAENSNERKLKKGGGEASGGSALASSSESEEAKSSWRLSRKRIWHQPKSRKSARRRHGGASLEMPGVGGESRLAAIES
jgi:hypothetical protein